MNVELITKKDLAEFREQLIAELKELFQPGATAPERGWLKSSEVRQLLRISPNTLQSLRISGKLHPTKLGGIFYYSRDEIHRLLEDKQS